MDNILLHSVYLSYLVKLWDLLFDKVCCWFWFVNSLIFHLKTFEMIVKCKYPNTGMEVINVQKTIWPSVCRPMIWYLQLACDFLKYFLIGTFWYFFMHGWKKMLYFPGSKVKANQIFYNVLFSFFVQKSKISISKQILTFPCTELLNSTSFPLCFNGIKPCLWKVHLLNAAPGMPFFLKFHDLFSIVIWHYVCHIFCELIIHFAFTE